MVQRLLFYGIHAETTGSSIRGQNQLIVLVGTNKAKSPLAITELAIAWAKVTLDTVVGKPVPVPTGDNSIRSRDTHIASITQDEVEIQSRIKSLWKNNCERRLR